MSTFQIVMTFLAAVVAAAPALYAAVVAAKVRRDTDAIKRDFGEMKISVDGHLKKFIEVATKLAFKEGGEEEKEKQAGVVAIARAEGVQEGKEMKP